MADEKVVAVLWVLVGVALVCFFAALVSAHAEALQWSRVINPPTVHPRGPFGR